MQAIMVQEIENLLGIKLHLASEHPDKLSGVMVITKGQAKYAMEADKLIGLNLAGVDLTDKQWQTVLRLDSFETTYLQALHLGDNRLASIEFSAAFSNLKLLDLSHNKSLLELRFTDGLSHLLRLNLDACALERLDFPMGFSTLETLQAVSNKLQEVHFAGAMPDLQYLDLSENELKKLTIPEGFKRLQYFYFRKNKVKSNISFLEPVPPQLNIVNLKNSQLNEIPDEIVFGEHLEWLNLQGNVPKNIPKLFLEKENCLSDARDWFAELRDAPSAKNKAVKLMITGNGGAGKTTLLCALKNGNCEHDHDSTHGIQIETWEDGTSEYNTWDFGGQEVYHGTHRLFMSSEAIQLILFTPDVQEKARAREKVWDRIRKEKILPHTVEYWYETIKALSPTSTFLFTQNQQDLFPDKDKIVRDYTDEKGAELRWISAKEGTGVRHLKNFLRTYAEEMPEYDMEMPQSWLKVRQFFIDNVQPGKKDNDKIVDQEFFEAKCKEHKVSERTWGLLKRYLHHSGYFYYHENLGDKIIADQKWALEAIYKPLDRAQDYYQELREDRGKIRVRNLFEIFGHNYEKNQKWLFLQFLKSCGLCFKVKTRYDDEKDRESDYYLFPEFLNDKSEERVDELWRKAEDIQKFRYQLPWLNYHVIQNFITNVGRKTNTEYIWRTGIYVPTKHGQFRVELDAAGNAIILSIEGKAMDVLLLSIIEAMGSYTDRDKWEVLINGQYEPFNREKGIPLMPKENIESISTIMGQGGTVLSEEFKAKTGSKGLMGLDEPTQTIVDKKIILFIAANPPETTKLGSQHTEFAKISATIDDEKFRIKPLYTASPKEMNNKIALCYPTIVHFCGHADKDSLEMHDDSKRESKPLEIPTLRDFFASVKSTYPQLELVILNACQSSTISAAISQNNIYSIGTSKELHSIQAIPFAEGFYHLYTRGRSVQESVGHGIRECGLELGTNNKHLFEIFHNGKKLNI